MAIQSDRDKYVPFHTTEDVVKALNTEAKKTATGSRSLWLHRKIATMLRRLGYRIDPISEEE